MIQHRLAIFLSLLFVASCGSNELECAEDPACQPAPPCGVAGCPDGGTAGGGGGAGGGDAGSGGDGGSGGAGGGGGTQEKPGAELCEAACRHVYIECGGFWLDSQGGLVDFGSCAQVCSDLSVEKVECYRDAFCFDWAVCDRL